MQTGQFALIPRLIAGLLLNEILKIPWHCKNGENCKCTLKKDLSIFLTTEPSKQNIECYHESKSYASTITIAELINITAVSIIVIHLYALYYL